MHDRELTVGNGEKDKALEEPFEHLTEARPTYRKVGILLSNVSSTVTSPLSGAWFASISCRIADMLILNSRWISVFPRTPFRSAKKTSRGNWKVYSQMLFKTSLSLCNNIKRDTIGRSYQATVAPDFDRAPAPFRSVSAP